MTTPQYAATLVETLLTRNFSGSSLSLRVSYPSPLLRSKSWSDYGVFSAPYLQSYLYVVRPCRNIPYIHKPNLTQVRRADSPLLIPIAWGCGRKLQGHCTQPSS